LRHLRCHCVPVLICLRHLQPLASALSMPLDSAFSVSILLAWTLAALFAFVRINLDGFPLQSKQSSALWLPFDFVGCVHSPTISLDVFAWWHLASPWTSPFIPIAFRIAVAVRFAFDMFTFVLYFRRFDFHGFPPQTMPPPAH
jgi:hypothetical protein